MAALNIRLLEEQCTQHEVDAIALLSSDFQGSEVPGEDFDMIASSFKIVTSNQNMWIFHPKYKARPLFLTDARYEAVVNLINAEGGLIKAGIYTKSGVVPVFREHINYTKDQKLKVGMDFRFLSEKTRQVYSKKLNLVSVNLNVFIPTNLKTILAIPSYYIDATVETKFSKILSRLESSGADLMLISGLEDGPYVLNARLESADDSPLHPGFFNYILVTKTDITIVSNSRDDFSYLKISLPVKAVPLAKFDVCLAALPAKQTILVNSEYLSAHYHALLQAAGHTLIEDRCVAELRENKSDKNMYLRMERANIVEGLALLKAFRIIKNSDPSLSEWEVSTTLTACRKLAAERVAEKNESFTKDYFRGDSFETIAAADANAGTIHYRPSEEKSALIEEYVLIDTGGQYYEGTTDTTRMVTMQNKMSLKMETAYAAVLKAVFATSTYEWPEENKEFTEVTDKARESLLATMNYTLPHGVSHGVGLYNSVHENVGADYQFLRPGHHISVEPGYYELDDHGVRVENVVRCEKKSSGKYGLTTITVVPHELHNMENYLTEEEMQYYWDYNEWCYRKLLEYMTDAEMAFFEDTYLKPRA